MAPVIFDLGKLVYGNDEEAAQLITEKISSTAFDPLEFMYHGVSFRDKSQLRRAVRLGSVRDANKRVWESRARKFYEEHSHLDVSWEEARLYTHPGCIFAYPFRQLAEVCSNSGDSGLSAVFAYDLRKLSPVPEMTQDYYRFDGEPKEILKMVFHFRRN